MVGPVDPKDVEAIKALMSLDFSSIDYSKPDPVALGQQEKAIFKKVQNFFKKRDTGSSYEFDDEDCYQLVLKLMKIVGKDGYDVTEGDGLPFAG